MKKIKKIIKKIPFMSDMVKVLRSRKNKFGLIERFQRYSFKKRAIKPELNKPTKHEQELINELQNGISALKVEIPLESAPAATKKWMNFKNNLREKILSNDPRNFLDWDVVAYNMFSGSSINEFKFIKSLPEWPFWKKAMVEPMSTNFRPYFSFPEVSENTIKQAYHIAQFETTTHKKIVDMDRIVDFGAGYGDMCKLVCNLGFTGEYILFDWPEFSLLQRFYLKLCGIKTDNIKFVSSLSELKQILAKKVDNELLIATWSISETSLEFRKEFWNIFLPNNFLIAYQNRFAAIDNEIYFTDFKNHLTNIKWYHFLMKYLPTENNKYLIGTKK